MGGEAGKLHRSLLGRAFSFPEPDSAFVMDGSSMGGWSRGRWGRERPLQLLCNFSYMCLARLSLTQGKEAAGIGQAWTPEQLASDNADGLGQDACGAPLCLQTPSLAIPGEKGLRHP